MTKYQEFLKELELKSGADINLVAVSKTKPLNKIMEVYEQGQRDFGENKVQEITWKSEELPKDIKWHFVGHLQRNKVKYLAPFVYLIHGVDSIRLAREIDKQAQKFERKVLILIQVHIAKEEAKFGVLPEELESFITELDNAELKNLQIAGLMGMATNTENQEIIKTEFGLLNQKFRSLKQQEWKSGIKMEILSMGMTNDYNLAIDSGSNMIRIGTKIFGAREL